MAPKDERSAKTATRFTATTPHASSKLGAGAAKSVPNLETGPSTGAPRNPASSIRGSTTSAETPEQRVARLRAAHQAAKNAQISRFDQILARARPIFDSAHKITVMGLVGLTAVCGLMTAYTAYDMLRHNRQRKLEFLEATQRMSAESLEAARLAYMRGEATDEQMKLVEDAHAREEGGEGFKMPSILSAPTPIRKEEEPVVEKVEPQAPESKSSKIWSMLSFGSKKEEGKSVNEATEAPPTRTLEEKRAMVQAARAAFEKEKENQRNGGPLDRVGIQESAQTEEAGQAKKKGWLW